MAKTDYLLLRQAGVRTVRDGLRWHCIEAVPGTYDWSSFLPMFHAAHETGTEVIWDLCHWGAPDWLNPFSENFPELFERFARAAALVIAEERLRLGVSDPVYLCPMNEISFWSWAGGSVKYFSPCAQNRGLELKRQLVRATICAVRAIREVLPQARFLYAEPLIHISSSSRRGANLARAHAHDAAKYEAWDMLAGRMEPDLGGSEDVLDIIGVNYYWNNQWVHRGDRTPLGHPAHVPLHALLLQVHERYQRPIVLSETGAEAGAAVGWIGQVCAEVRRAQALGASIHGMCLYPVTDYPGWDDDRHVPTGLLEMNRGYRKRSLRSEIVQELQVQGRMLDMVRRQHVDAS